MDDDIHHGERSQLWPPAVQIPQGVEDRLVCALMFELLPPLNDHNLPWMDTIHPIVVHFVIAMAVIAVLFDLIGSLARRPGLYEVSFWNLLVATAAIFVAIIFGQVEAGLAEPYGAASEILNLHSTIGWSLAGVLAVLTAWRYVIRSKDPTRLPVAFLGAGGLLVVLVAVQVTLGNQLIWTYGLHTVPVVEAIRAGLV
jgi:uncharacterized membrane protein